MTRSRHLSKTGWYYLILSLVNSAHYIKCPSALLDSVLGTRHIAKNETDEAPALMKSTFEQGVKGQEISIEYVS